MFNSGRKTRSKRFTGVRNEFIELFVIRCNEGRKVKYQTKNKIKKITGESNTITPMMSFVLSSG
jgi:hypothetical protein